MLLCCTQSTEQSPGKTSRGKGLPLTVVSSNLDAVRGWEEAVPALPAAHAGQLQRHLAQRHVVVEGVLQQRGNIELGQMLPSVSLDIVLKATVSAPIFSHA